MNRRLDKQVALITGGSRGIGLSIAQAYAREGAKVVLLATDQDKLEEAVKTLDGPVENFLTIKTDVTNESECHKAVDVAERHFGRIDILVNNAGKYKGLPFLSYTSDDFQELFNVNFFGVLHFTQACLSGMINRQYGRIINIASTAGKWGSKGQCAYNVSKHAVVGLTRCVALEVASTGVTVNAICPGFVQTDMVESLKAEASKNSGLSPDAMVQSVLNRVPMGRVLKVDEIAGLAVYMASQSSSGMTGQSIPVDGGMVLT